MTILNQDTARIDKQWAATAEIDLRQYWQVVNRAKYKILALALVAAALAMLWVFNARPVYQATATLLIEAGSANVTSIEEIYTPNSQSQEYFQTQIELLSSPTLATKVIKQLQLIDKPEYAGLLADNLQTGWRAWLPGSSGQADIKSAALQQQLLRNIYLNSLEIAPIDQTQLVEVEFEAHDPALAAEIANAHAGSYITNIMDTRLNFNQSATDAMAERLREVKANLQESERALQEFREREQVFDAEGLQSLPSKELNELTTRLVGARRALELAGSSATQVNQLQISNPAALESIPAVAQNRLVQEFKQQQAAGKRKVAELGKIYGPRHPKMVAAESELRTANQNLARQINTVVEGITKSYDIAKEEMQALQASVAEAKQQYHDTGRKESELLTLQRGVQTDRQLYDIFYNRMKETAGASASDLQNANARVVAPAIAPLKPVRPNKGLLIGMAFIGSLMLGILLAFLVEALDDTLKNTAQVEGLLRVPLLGAIPLLQTKNKSPVAAGRTFLKPGEQEFKEAIRTIRTGITLSRAHKTPKVLQITSAVTGEGKSVTALNLAYAFGQMNQVLLVECDLRRPSLGVQLKIPADMPGLSQLLANEASLEECIFYPDSDKIQFITAGAVPPNPLELLSSPTFTKLMLQLRHDYDLVIVDCPPMLPVSDATMIATQMDAAVYVIRAGSTSLNQIKAGLDKLRRTDIPVAGVVINGLHARDVENYGGYYGSSEPARA